MQIIAHRGGHDGDPTVENTPLAFSKAVALDVEMLELDARLTKDKQLIVHHDSMANGRRIKFADRNLDDLVADGTCVKELFRDQRKKVPTLELVLRVFLPQIKINIELKEKGSAKALIELLKYQEFVSDELFKKNLLISSFEASEVVIVKKEFRFIETALLMKKYQFPLYSRDQKLIDALGRLGVEGIHLPSRRAKKEMVTYLKKKGFKVRVFTINDSQSMSDCLYLGVDGIFTDKRELFANPDRFYLIT